MTWTRLGDDFTDRPEMLEVSRSARLLLIEAMVWSNRMLTNGRVPVNALRRISDSAELEIDIKELVRVCLLTDTGDGGWQIDWEDQEEADDVKARQDRRAATQKRYRRRKELHEAGDHSLCDPRFCTKAVTGNATGNATGNKSGHETPSRPVPSRPLGRDRGTGGHGDSAGAPSPTPHSEKTSLPYADDLPADPQCMHGQADGLVRTNSEFNCPECQELVGFSRLNAKQLRAMIDWGCKIPDPVLDEAWEIDLQGHYSAAHDMAAWIYDEFHPDDEGLRSDLELFKGLVCHIYECIQPGHIEELWDRYNEENP